MTPLYIQIPRSDKERIGANIVVFGCFSISLLNLLGLHYNVYRKVSVAVCWAGDAYSRWFMDIQLT